MPLLPPPGPPPSCWHGVAPVLTLISISAGGTMACLRWLPSLQLLRKSVLCIKHRVCLFPFGQFCHCKAKGIMKVGVQSMVEMVLLQIPPSIRKVLQVRVSNHHNCIMYVEHVLLHHLILLLLNLIQCPYHGIVVMFVTNVFTMCISRSCTEISLPSSRVWAHLLRYLWRLAKICGCTLASSYCSRKASTLKRQSVYVTSTPGSVNLKIGISNLVGANRFFSLLPLWPLHQC